MLIKRVNTSVIDVFWGQGWDNWARVKTAYFNGKPKLIVLNKKMIPAAVFKKLHGFLFKIKIPHPEVSVAE